VDDERLLGLLPLKKTWLDDIVGVFLKRSNGEGEVDAIVIALLKTDREIGVEVESTVTRTINNFCVNAEDADEKMRHPVFKRIGPGKYKLLSYPNSPDLIEMQNILFSDHAHQRLWTSFTEKAKSSPKWKTLSKRERLVVFSRNILQNEGLQNLLKAYEGESLV